MLSGIRKIISDEAQYGSPCFVLLAKLEGTQYKDWSLYRLTNGLVALYIAPEPGGRAIQLQLGDREYFFVNLNQVGKVLLPDQNNPKAGWANYGGDKVLPAPEGWMNDHEWPGVPYYSLHGSKFDAEVTLNKSIAVPADAFRVSVRVLDAEGENCGFLGNVPLN